MRPAHASARKEQPRHAPEEAVFTPIPSPFPPITPAPCQPHAECVQPHERQRAALSINKKAYLLAVILLRSELNEREFLDCKAPELNGGEWLAVCTPNEEPQRQPYNHLIYLRYPLQAWGGSPNMLLSGTGSSLVHPSGLIRSFCSCSRDFPSNFLSLGSLPPRSCPSGLGFRVIAALRGLSPQCAYRVGHTPKQSRRLLSTRLLAKERSRYETANVIRSHNR